MGFLNFFKTLFGRVWGAAKKAGLTDEMIDYAKVEALKAAKRFAEGQNAEKRDWVLAILMKKFGVPESLARFILESAIQLIKQES